MRYILYCRKSSESEDRQAMSIESQRSELERTFRDREGIEIIDVLVEAKSAKAPGRPVFGELLGRIERREVDGIVAWAPDRLARNSIDGGAIVYLLDRGLLKDLKFATYTFENNSQGKFMLQIMFGQSKYYSDALSENVRRGNRTKVANGWRPNLAPLGYLNDRSTKTIVLDPVYHSMVRQVFELALAGHHSVREIAIIARDEWAFRTPVRRKLGGTPLSLSSLYKMLSNPFYAGLIPWAGELHAGRHPPLVTIGEFERVQARIKRIDRHRPKRREFTFSGLIRCGSCGRMVTAEHKRNRHGQRYIYYHCTRGQLNTRCREPSIEARALEGQLEAFLRTLQLPDSLWKLAAELQGQAHEAGRQAHAARLTSINAALRDVERQLGELLALRLRGLVTDGEYVEGRSRLQREEALLLERGAEARALVSSIEPAHVLGKFSNQAADIFRSADTATKREIVRIVSSNLTLKSKRLSVQAANPFICISETAPSTSLLAGVHDVRTSRGKRSVRRVQKFIDATGDLSASERSRLLGAIRLIAAAKERVDREVA